MVKEIIFIIIMTFFTVSALRKKVKWKIAVPFFIISLVILSNIGISDRHSFVDSDLVFHKTLTDGLAGQNLLRHDPVVRYYLETYPKGYHFLALLCSGFGLSFAQGSKILGLILSLLTPFLCFFLGRQIYDDRQTAFFCGFFCGLASIQYAVYCGLPRSIGFILFMAGLLLLFKTRDKKQGFFSILALNLIFLLLWPVHPYSAVILWGISVCFFITMLFKNREKDISRTGHFLAALGFLAVYVLGWLLFKHKDLAGLSSWQFVRENYQIFSGRVPYSLVDFPEVISQAGILPLGMFISTVARFCLDQHFRDKYKGLLPLLVATFSLLAGLWLVISVNGLFFLKAHRFAEFISLLMYLSGVWILKSAWDKITALNKPVYAYIFAFALTLPGAFALAKGLDAPRLPYEMDKVCVRFSPGETKPDFSELLDLAVFTERELALGETIACSIDIGDMVRMYAMRPVTSSWKIGGMMTTYKQALHFYRQQLADTEELYSAPLRLAQRHGVKYFLFNKDKLAEMSDIIKEFKPVWESDNLIMYYIDIKGKE